ncbi:hypothetical protein BABINDRAFT_160359 [Babjeviella inositovora NRRL Y-12698]|uniref:Uncharacterized protein n=1 Tax=Babjeviella inositovora NRRL Y-12698 TaxID=984486 RepID=A0A1E3QTA3_9ASCO|nr:uncharacterized protein BABINDRAFT_160359 [Babjeviella inositovora NRRL Y-12698]ODQ80919.1 hypothetical protein BABINDRAFT_160359 [Babjeviella inositovora NRRL Y-12698]
MFRAATRFARLAVPMAARPALPLRTALVQRRALSEGKKGVSEFAEMVKNSPEVMSKLVELRRFMSDKGYDTLEFNKSTLMKMMMDGEIRSKLQEVAGELEKTGMDPTQFDFKELYKNLKE